MEILQKESLNTENLFVAIVMWCKKELLNTMGGWIITAVRSIFAMMVKMVLVLINIVT